MSEILHSRRRMLLAALASSASASTFGQLIESALAVPAHRRTGTLADIRHVVFLMQENRSFDHYFGSLAGVRGFNDPRAIRLPSGLPVWYQPDGERHVLPWHHDVRNTNALRIGLDHSWKGSEQTWKNWDAWIAKKTARTMGFFDRGDLPFYYALADAFTICDRYHCSVFGPTDPNRFYALSGHANGALTGIPDKRLYNVHNGIYNADASMDHPDARGLEWQTYADILEANGISWKVYQEWDNYGDNYLQYFRQFRVDENGRPLTAAHSRFQRCRALAPGSTAENAKGTQGQFLINAFAADVRADRLPAVSWICAPTEYCEHPEETPNAGEHFTARLLAALVDQPEVWAKTLVILTYDENDGFFDHQPSVLCPLSNAHGASTTSADGERAPDGEPIGLGPRVPTLILSPWSKGGRVNSQLFDHTSQLQFLESWLVQAYGLSPEAVHCAGISPWRRAVCGDLQSTLNLQRPDAVWPRTLPKRARYEKKWGSAESLPPAQQSLPSQERARGNTPRPACPLPYRSSLDLQVKAAARTLVLQFDNPGTSGEAFVAYSQHRDDGPWHFTVSAGQTLNAALADWRDDRYHLQINGANGFLRERQGVFSGAFSAITLRSEARPTEKSLHIHIGNIGTATLKLHRADLTYGRASQHITLLAGERHSWAIPLRDSYGWYDERVRRVGRDSGNFRQKVS